MKSKKLETYAPKKTIREKTTPFLRSFLNLLVIGTVIVLTIYATKYIVEQNYQKDNYDSLSNQIIIHTGKLIDSIEPFPGQRKDFESESQTDYSTLIQDLLKSEMIGDLPKGAVLELRFYHFDSGGRVWEKSYLLKKDSVEEGQGRSDIQIIMHSKYVNGFKNKSLCEVIINAQNQGDLRVETQMTQNALMWKYKNMLKYRSCLGI